MCCISSGSSSVRGSGTLNLFSHERRLPSALHRSDGTDVSAAQAEDHVAGSGVMGRQERFLLPLAIQGKTRTQVGSRCLFDAVG